MMYLLALYIAFPAFIANILPVIAAHQRMLPILSGPVHERLLGSHKTWRGFIVGTVGGGVAALVQWFVFAPHLPSMWYALLFGLVAGFGALLGDAVKSFVKRRIGIAPGKPLIPFDYIDYMVGFLVCTYPLYQWSVVEGLVVVGAALVLNPLTNMFGYWTGLKSTYW
jgi:CDP-2,3-bis-(O-geranylgeranyl)-sn-glycerol synthase